MRLMILVTALLAMSCAGWNAPPPSPEQKRFKSQSQAGSVLVGVQSVAPFESYVDALQPRFNLTSEQALDSALATTQLQEIEELRALLLSIAVNLPTQTTSITEQIQRTDDQTTSSRTESTTDSTGAVPSTSAPTTVTRTLTQLDDAVSAISLDAALRYRAAAALLQEVNLLSNYVRDAAVESGSVPYVVRMLLTVFPSAHRAPYDVYTNISFFLDSETSHHKPFFYNRNRIVESRYGVVQGAIRNCAGQSAKAIPLFVTDNLETSVVRSAREGVTDLGATLGGSVGGAGVGVGGRSQRDSKAAALGRGLNALFTLGTAADNTLAVRLGAVTYDGGYEVVPRTYNLTALVLVPTVRVDTVFGPELLAEVKNLHPINKDDLFVPCSSVVYRSYSGFTDALEGSPLPSSDIALLEKTLKSRGINKDELVQAVLADDFKMFRDNYPDESIRSGHAPEYAWAMAVAARSRTGFAGGRFEVPRPIFRFFPTSDIEKIALVDDKKTSSIQLSGAAGLVSKGISGQVTIGEGKGSLTLHSTNVTLLGEGTGARIEFPSVRQVAETSGLTLDKVKIEVRYIPPSRNWSPTVLTAISWIQHETPIVKSDPPASTEPATGFTISASSPHIRINEHGVGQVRMEIRTSGEKDKVAFARFAVEGGVVREITPTAAVDGADLVLTTDRSYLVSLGNLITGHTVKLRAWRLDGKKKIEAPAVPLAIFELTREDERE